MDILLSDVEIADLFGVFTEETDEYDTAVAKAQAIKLIKYLEEPCKEHKIIVVGGSYNHGSIIKHYDFAAHRYNCTECLAEIKKELGI